MVKLDSYEEYEAQSALGTIPVDELIAILDPHTMEYNVYGTRENGPYNRELLTIINGHKFMDDLWNKYDPKEIDNHIRDFCRR